MPEIRATRTITLTVKVEEPTRFTAIEYGPKSITVKPGATFTVKFSRIAWDKPLPTAGVLKVEAFIDTTRIGERTETPWKGSTEFRNLVITCRAPEKPGKYTVRLVITLRWFVPGAVPGRPPIPLALTLPTPLVVYT